MTAPVVGSWGAPAWTASVANSRSCVRPFWPLEKPESPAIVIVTGLKRGQRKTTERIYAELQSCRRDVAFETRRLAFEVVFRTKELQYSVTGSNHGLYARSLRPLICNDGNIRQSETSPGDSREKVLSIYNGMAVAAENSSSPGFFYVAPSPSPDGRLADRETIFDLVPRLVPIKTLNWRLDSTYLDTSLFILFPQLLLTLLSLRW